MKKFTKINLENGLVVVYRNGWRRIVFNGSLLDENFSVCSCTKFYDDNLLEVGGDTNLDIVKVENPLRGEVLWEREKYTNFDWLKENIKNMTVKEYLTFISCKDRPCPCGSCDKCREAWLNSER